MYRGLESVCDLFVLEASKENDRKLEWNGKNTEQRAGFGGGRSTSPKERANRFKKPVKTHSQ